MSEPYRLATVMPAGPRRPRWVVPTVIALAALLIASVAAIVVLLMRHPAGPSSTKTAAPPFTVSGTFTLKASTSVLNIDGVKCTGMNGYDDLGGAQLVVTDSTGRVVATGALAPSGNLVGSGFTRLCVWGFTIDGIPSGLGFYGVEVSHRGRVQYTEAEIRGHLDLSIG